MENAVLLDATKGDDIGVVVARTGKLVYTAEAGEAVERVVKLAGTVNFVEGEIGFNVDLF
jgi:hypothetical protein